MSEADFRQELDEARRRNREARARVVSTTPEDFGTVTYFTFGVQYAYNEHPLGFDRVHPDGWWEVVGVSREEAIKLVHALTGGKYAFDYGPDFPEAAHFYPRGCVYRLRITRGVVR